MAMACDMASLACTDCSPHFSGSTRGKEWPIKVKGF